MSHRYVQMKRLTRADLGAVSIVAAGGYRGKGGINYMCRDCGNVVLENFTLEQASALIATAFECQHCGSLMGVRFDPQRVDKV